MDVRLSSEQQALRDAAAQRGRSVRAALGRRARRRGTRGETRGGDRRLRVARAAYLLGGRWTVRLGGRGGDRRRGARPRARRRGVHRAHPRRRAAPTGRCPSRDRERDRRTRPRPRRARAPRGGSGGHRRGGRVRCTAPRRRRARLGRAGGHRGPGRPHPSVGRTRPLGFGHAGRPTSAHSRATRAVERTRPLAHLPRTWSA